MNASRSRKKIGISHESAMELMQEIYVEIVDERNKAIQTFKKFSRNTEANTDIAMVGKIANELLKIVDSAIEKKIKLLKIQTDILYKTGKAGDESEKDFKLGEDTTALIHKELKEAVKSMGSENNSREYET
jgi:hypothetical protein